MSPAEVLEVREKSIAHKYGLKPGDQITAINGRPLRDILDYEMNVAEELVSLEVVRNGKSQVVTIENPSFNSLGIIFSTSLFDGIKTCANKCVFCFVDQLPAGMRRELYVKDDDYRLSFLYGNFVTLTNARDEEIDRIIRDRLSPLYVSVHATDPELRAFMLGRKKKDRSLEYINRLSDAGIELHVQMVICPGLNDGNELEKSIDDLANKYSGISSIGLVPVGLTGYRDEAYNLRSFSKQEIIYLVEQVQRWQTQFERDKGYAWVYIADEFYIAGGCELPPAEHYGEFPQIENGIGLSRLFIDEIMENSGEFNKLSGQGRVAVATGSLFSGIMKMIVEDIDRDFGIKIDVIEVENAFFGGAVNVTGLLTGSDILASAGRWFRNNGKPSKLLLPDVTLNGDGLMLDGYSPKTLEEQLDTDIEFIKSSGAGFVEGIKMANSH